MFCAGWGKDIHWPEILLHVLTVAVWNRHTQGSERQQVYGKLRKFTFLEFSVAGWLLIKATHKFRQIYLTTAGKSNDSTNFLDVIEFSMYESDFPFWMLLSDLNTDWLKQQFS